MSNARIRLAQGSRGVPSGFFSHSLLLKITECVAMLDEKVVPHEAHVSRDDDDRRATSSQPRIMLSGR